MLIRNLIYFQADPGAGGGTPPPAMDPAPDATPAATGGGEPAKTFTQAELDKLLGERAKRAESSGVEALLKKLGVASADELKATVEAHKQAEQARLSDVEKLQGQMGEFQKQLAELTTERDTLAAELEGERIKNAVIGKAAALGFESPEDAYRLLMAEPPEIKVEDGKVKGFDKPLDELAKSGRLKMKAPEGGPKPLGTPSRHPSAKPPSATPATPNRPIVRL